MALSKPAAGLFLRSRCVVRKSLFREVTDIISKNGSTFSSININPPRYFWKPATFPNTTLLSMYRRSYPVIGYRELYTDNRDLQQGKDTVAASTGTGTMANPKSGNSSSTLSASASNTTTGSIADPDVSTTSEQPLSRRAKLKQAVKDYGSTVLVFHITMSLCSLGLCYILISSGLDMVALLEKIGIGEKILQSWITQGASTFVIAYAVHKVFAPVRITITLTATPLIVKKLRLMGILKKPIAK